MEDKKEELIKAATEIFSEYGYKKTNISMITKRAGMAVGSFYSFFNSKEEIFMKVHLLENNRVRKKITDSVKPDDDLQKTITAIFSGISENILSNKILREWYNPQIREKLKEYYRHKEIQKENYFSNFIMDTLGKMLSERGYPEEETKRILKVLDFLSFIDLNVRSEEFDGYENTVKTLMTYFLKGVFS